MTKLAKPHSVQFYEDKVTKGCQRNCTECLGLVTTSRILRPSDSGYEVCENEAQGARTGFCKDTSR